MFNQNQRLMALEFKLPLALCDNSLDRAMRAFSMVGQVVEPQTFESHDQLWAKLYLIQPVHLGLQLMTLDVAGHIATIDDMTVVDPARMLNSVTEDEMLSYYERLTGYPVYHMLFGRENVPLIGETRLYHCPGAKAPAQVKLLQHALGRQKVLVEIDGGQALADVRELRLTRHITHPLRTGETMMRNLEADQFLGFLRMIVQQNQ